MKLLTHEQMFWRIKNNPQKYPLMLLNPRLHNRIVKRLEHNFFIYPVEYKAKTLDGMVMNYYKRDPNTIKQKSAEMSDNLKAKLSYPENENFSIYDEMVKTSESTYLMLFTPKLPSRIKNDEKMKYMTDVIRHKGRYRSGVICVCTAKLPEPDTNKQFHIAGYEKL